MFRFGEPIYLYLLLILPILVILYLYSNYRRRKKIRQYGDPELLAHLMPDVSKYRPDVKFWLVSAALTMVIFMLARPQFGSKMETVKRQGVETVVALDISNSMLAEDVAPSRLEKSKKLISRLVETFNNDKVAMIVFAGEAFTQLPITSDYISAKMFLETITPSLISTQGTDIRGAIRVFVLGVGSPDGSPIPTGNGNEFRRDKDGNVIVTKLNEQMCQEIAKAGNGMYVRVDNTNNAERALNAEINKLAKADVETQIFTEFNEQFQVLAWMALILLAIDLMILERRNPLFKNVKLFKQD